MVSATLRPSATSPGTSALVARKPPAGNFSMRGRMVGSFIRPCGLDAPRGDGMPQPRRRRYGDACAVTVIRCVRCEPRASHMETGPSFLVLRAVRCRSFARCERLSWDVPGFSFLNTDFIDASSGIEQGGAPRTTDSFMFDVSSSAVSISKASRSGSPRQPIAAGAWVDPGRRAGGGRLGEPCI